MTTSLQQHSGVESSQMTATPQSPFSARNRREKAWVEGDFPLSARTGLLHILNAAVNADYLPGWYVVAKELGRISRSPVKNYSRTHASDIEQAHLDSEIHLHLLDWEKVYDFCERLHGYLAEDVTRESDDDSRTVTRAESQHFFAEEMQRLFEEENLAYEFRDGLVQRRGRRHTVDQINKAETALDEARLTAARKHFSKALRNFRNREKPDHENAVKEAVCAVEAAAKELFPESRASTFGEFLKWATQGRGKLIPSTIGKTLEGLYAFRSSGEGVAHGATSGGAVTPELSEYVLGVAASQVILLVELAQEDDEPPF